MKNFGKIGNHNVQFTWHALQRMVEMQLSVADIRNLICDPTDVYESRKYPGDICHRRGDYTLAYVLHNDLMVIKTVLYGTQKAWLKAFKEGRLTADRELDFDKLRGLPQF